MTLLGLVEAGPGLIARPGRPPLAPAAQQLYNLIHQAGKTAKRKPASAIAPITP